MLNLVIGTFLVCSSLGATMSKLNKDNGVKKYRTHKKPLVLDKDVL